jgi:hypothetical protein
MAVALAVAEAASSGVTVDAVHEDEVIWISSIERDGGRPGSGADVLQSFMEIADDHGVPLRAAVVRDHDRLLGYYGELGFEPVAHHTSACGRSWTITIEYMP